MVIGAIGAGGAPGAGDLAGLWGRADLGVWAGAGAVGLGVVVLGVMMWGMNKGAKLGASNATETARADVQQAEELAKLLRELTAELDVKADRLEKLLEKAELMERKLDQSGGRLEPRRAVARETEAVPGNVIKPEGIGAGASPVEGGDEFSRKVYQMADQGRSAVEIAQGLNSHIGKVELILSLRGMRRGG
jgi:hypothetical protein